MTVFDFSSQNDKWSKGQEEFVTFCRTNRYALTFAWGPFGHTADNSKFHPAVVEFPWFAIRKDEATIRARMAELAIEAKRQLMSET